MSDIKTYQHIVPNDGNAWLTISLINDLQGKYQSALVAADRFVKYAPKNSVGYEQKANILLEMKRPKDALACVRAASSALPSLTPRLQCEMRMASAELALFVEHDEAKAVSQFQQACATPFFYTGDAERIAHLVVPYPSADISLQIMQRVTAKNPTVTTLTVLADCAARAGDRKVTEDSLTVLGFRAPKYVAADIEAQTMFVLGDFARSADAAQRALKESSDTDGHLHKLLVAALQRKGEHTKASEVLAEAVQVAPGDLGMLERHCTQLAMSGKLSQCRDLIKTFREKNPTSAGAADLLEARALVAGDQYRQALATLNRMIAAEPKNAQALFLRGKVYKGLLLDDLAISDFGSALSAGADRRKVYAARGECLARSKRIDEAREDFRRAAI